MTQLDCPQCGACCQHSGFVLVGRDDTTPRGLTRSVRGMIGFASYEADYSRRMQQDADGRCAALRGTVGEAVRCSCYARRPTVCREFKPGSDQCWAARDRAGIE